MVRIRTPNKNRKIDLILCGCGCGEVFNKFDSRNRPRKCINGHISESQKQQLREYRLGKPGWNKGKKCPQISKALKNNVNGRGGKGKIKIALRGKNNPMYGKKGNHCPIFGKRGDKHPAWKGGISSLNELIRKSIKNLEWKAQVFGRDNFTCQKCGQRGSWLEAHHITGMAKLIKTNNIKNIEDAYKCDDLWNLNNGITLCKECHKKTKNYGYKKE